jgi:hypothetical protein
MAGTVFPQTRRKDMKAGGQFSYESCIGAERFEDRDNDTDGGFVVDRKAAKYRQSAGPVCKVFSINSSQCCRTPTHL